MRYRSFRHLMEQWPEPHLRSFADDVGRPYATVQVWKHRDTIRDVHWPLIVAAAIKRGIPDVTYEVLMHLRQRSLEKKRSAASQAAA